MNKSNFSIKFINHASLQIKGQNNYLTDPWYISNAFGKWTQNPPPSFSDVKNILKTKKLNILVSHGHDDHVDDFFIRNYLKNNRIIIPKLNSKGFLRRIEKLSDKNIIEVEENGLNISNSNEKIYSFICDETQSVHDSIMIITNKKEAIIHANDNWHVLGKKIRESIKKVCEGKYIYYFSQVGIANSFPIYYGKYSLRDMKLIIKKRMINYLKNLKVNIDLIKPDMTISYANQSKFTDELDLNTYQIAQEFIQNFPHVTQLNPGDKIVNGKIFINKKKLNHLPGELLKLIEKKFKEFMRAKNNKVFTVKFISSNKKKEFLENTISPKKNEIYYVAQDYVWSDIFSGKLNLETISIGGNGYIFKNKKTNIISVHQNLSEFSYIFQNVICKKYFN